MRVPEGTLFPLYVSVKEDDTSPEHFVLEKQVDVVDICNLGNVIPKGMAMQNCLLCRVLVSLVVEVTASLVPLLRLAEMRSVTFC